MADDIYRPWRRNDHDDDLLADDVSAQWRQLLDDSKRCVSELRRTTRLANQQFGAATAHERICRRLDEFERRLSALEYRLAATAESMLRKKAA